MLPRSHYLKQPYCDTRLPRDLGKAGMSAAQARLIKKHGILIRALLENQVTDPSTEDLHLLKAIQRGCNPRTPLEQAWLKYLDLIEQQPPLARSPRVLRQTA